MSVCIPQECAFVYKCVWFLTSTSPVSFSLRTKLSLFGSAPAINLRRRGRSPRGSFWNRSAESRNRTKKNISFRFVNYTYFLNNKLVSRCLFLTLSITVCLPVQRKLAGIVQHHELLQQALDDFSGGVLRANVELLHTVRRQVEGCSLVTGLAVRPLLAF